VIFRAGRGFWRRPPAKRPAKVTTGGQSNAPRPVVNLVQYVDLINGSRITCHPALEKKKRSSSGN
jgi:hypothetical protein